MTTTLVLLYCRDHLLVRYVGHEMTHIANVNRTGTAAEIEEFRVDPPDWTLCNPSGDVA